MQLNSVPQLAIALIALAEVAHSGPSAISPRSSPVYINHRELAKRDVNCPNYVAWGDFPSANAPTIEDCEALRDTLTGPETATFPSTVDFTNVGEEDLFNFLTQMIVSVGRNGYFQVKGQLFCKAADGVTEVGVNYKVDLPAN
ncbi:hypothetical protein OQA88_10654 [Cercophora sp. LCS_1]